tara:strand:- start:1006 stop:1155 length:150 start_codon:yes stop_codon:yes gene_type:complete
MDDVEVLITGVSMKSEVKVDNNRSIGQDKGDVGNSEESSSERDDTREDL